jgi:hypothetical protein
VAEARVAAELLMLILVVVVVVVVVMMMMVAVVAVARLAAAVAGMQGQREPLQCSRAVAMTALAEQSQIS